MSRRIMTGVPTQRVGLAEQNLQQPQVPTEEDFLGRLLKYIPAEIVGLYLAVRAIIPPKAEPGSDTTTVLFIIAAVCWLLVPIYLWVATSRDGKEPLLIQI